MSDTTQLDSPKRVSRRTVVKGGLAVGGALWAAPAVEVLTASKAYAATASGGTGKSISYVMLVLQSATGAIFTAKIDVGKSLSPSCPGSPSDDANALWTSYIGQWSTTTMACPSDLQVVGFTETSITIDLGGNTLLGFMVHDGSLNTLPGKAGFASWTTIPAGASALPAGWTAPGSGATGTVTFTK
jgi:hypothetical protein